MSFYTDAPVKKFKFNKRKVVEIILANRMSMGFSVTELIKFISECHFSIKTSDYNCVDIRKVHNYKDYVLFTDYNDNEAMLINEIKITYSVNVFNLSAWEDLLDYYCGFVRSSPSINSTNTSSTIPIPNLFKMAVEKWDTPFSTDSERYFAWRWHCLNTIDGNYKTFGFTTNTYFKPYKTFV